MSARGSDTRFDGARDYLVRLVFYALCATMGSILGTRLTWLNDNWVNARPLAGPPAVLLSLGPAILIAAMARFSARAIAAVGAMAFAAMIAMWWQFANSGSSTAVFVFFLGWWAGIPTATLLLALARRQATGAA